MLLVLTFAAGCLALSGCSNQVSDAATLAQKGDVSDACVAYQQILKDQPHNREALDGAAVCLFELKRYDEALVLEERLASLDPKDAQIRVELGFNYLNHQSRPADAEKALGEAAKLDPSAKNLCFLSQAEVATWNFSSAEKSLRQAITTQPDYSYSYELLSRLLKDQGRIWEAEQVIQQAASRGVNITQKS